MCGRRKVGTQPPEDCPLFDRAVRRELQEMDHLEVWNCGASFSFCVWRRAVLNGKKRGSGTSFPKKARGHSMCSTTVGGGWRLAVGGGWRWAVGNWRLVAVGGGWQRLVVGDWWLVAVGSGWQFAVGRRWRLAAVGGWRLVAVGGWWSLGAVLKGGPSQKKTKTGPLRTALVWRPLDPTLCAMKKAWRASQGNGGQQSAFLGNTPAQHTRGAIDKTPGSHRTQIPWPPQ